MDYRPWLAVIAAAPILVSCAQGGELSMTTEATTEVATSGSGEQTSDEATDESSEGPETSSTSPETGTETETETDTDTETTDDETTTGDPTETDTEAEPEPFCGDGLPDPDESCDDGNTVQGDGCNNNCEPSGQELWDMRVGSETSASDQGFAITVDDEGFYYVGGYLRTPPDQGANAWLTKYGPAGEIVWTYNYNGESNGNDVIRAVAVDQQKNVYFAGNARYDLDNVDDLWVVKLDPEGVFVWDDRVKTLALGNDRGHGILVTDTANTVVTGYLRSPSQGNNVWVRQYDPDGVNLWTRTYNGLANKNDVAYAIAAASDDSLYIGGYEQDAESIKRALLVKFTDGGEQLWTKQFGPEAQAAEVRGVAVGPEDDVYACGFQWHETAGQELWVSRFTPDGDEVWTHTYQGELGDGARGEALAVGADGALVVTGYEEIGDDKRLLLRKLDSDGNPMWTRQVFGGGVPNDIAHGVAIGDDLEVYATGQINEPMLGLELWIGRFSP